MRFYLTNTANTRVFNVALPGARMKLVGGDSGRCEQEEFVDEVLLAPSERAVVDVLFDEPGRSTLEHRTPGADATAGRRSPSSEEPAAPSLVPSSSRSLRTQRGHGGRAASASRRTWRAAPDKTLAFVAEMDMGVPEGEPVVYACPMHPEVVSDEAGQLPASAG